MQLLIGNHLVLVFDGALLDPLVVLFQLSHQELKAILLPDEGVVGEGDVEAEGSGFHLVHEPFEVVPASLDHLFLA